MNHIFLATAKGLEIAERADGEWRVREHALPGRRVTSVIAREGVILAGTPDGVMRSDDLGKTWRDASQGLSTRYVRWLAYHPDHSDREFAGTEPAGIFVSHDGAASWRECSEIPPLRDKFHWFLPYSKGAGCVRGFAFCGSRGYAAVEVGGALRSDDFGETWRLCDGSNGDPDLDGPPAPLIYPDVHSIETHSATPDWAFAPTGGGFYISRDAGATWMLAYDCYVRAMWVDPNNADHFLLGPAEHVDSGGRIEESRDGGKTWQLASDGLTVPWAHHMVERFKQVDDEVFAVLSNGEVYVARVEAWQWRRAFASISNVNALWAM